MASLLFNMQSSFAITFLPRRKSVLSSWLWLPSAVILKLKKIKSVIASTFSPSICHDVMGLDTMIWIFWMMSFMAAFSLFSFTLIKRLFSSFYFLPLKWYHLHIWSCWYCLAISIPACDSSFFQYEKAKIYESHHCGQLCMVHTISNWFLAPVL